MTNQVTLLGTGPSAGVPLIGCECSVCIGHNIKNRRSRSSVVMEINSNVILIDTSPDFREQALRCNIKQLDAVLYTHAHADHTHGIDDVRSINFHKNAPIQAYGLAETFEELQARFGYAFKPHQPEKGWYRPCLEPNVITMYQPFFVKDVEIRPFEQSHGFAGKTLGFRVGNFVYSTDVVAFPEASEPYLYNLDVWVLDCLQFLPAPSHAHLDLALGWIKKFRPKRAILTHMSHVMDYESLSQQLPEGVEMGYDQMQIKLP